MKILIADPLCEKGHLNFNLNIIKWFNNDQNISIDLYLSESMLKDMSMQGIAFKDSLLTKGNKYKYKLNQLKIINDIYKYAIDHKYDKLIFLSYELFSTAAFLNLKKFRNNLEIVLFEHNTVPNSFAKELLYRAIPTYKITHVGLMPYISKYITEKFHKKSIYIPHPIRLIIANTNEIKSNDVGRVTNVFMPSFVEENLKHKICASFDTLGNKFILRTKGKLSKFKNVYTQEFFYNYDENMLDADAIFIPQKFDYRVSGVLFEALQTDAKIFMSNCLFSKSLKEKFESKIVIVDDWEHYIRHEFINEINNRNGKERINREAFNSVGFKLLQKELLCQK
ncbi:hypothetical protein [Enterobacter hormaechei]|uniref:hypothetical protein n=1 Tax=Enterobacter hormaechei TaxID=158836 RepID=UPI00197D9A73|nr:hypothetical protein [Enterobacter hormaechei]MBN4832045.1 hypothetical protein [Enterobacter hormaechei]